MTLIRVFIPKKTKLTTVQCVEYLPVKEFSSETKNDLCLYQRFRESKQLTSTLAKYFYFQPQSVSKLKVH